MSNTIAGRCWEEAGEGWSWGVDGGGGGWGWVGVGGVGECGGGVVTEGAALRAKLQALVYDILPSTTAVFSYAIGSRKTVS